MQNVYSVTQVNAYIKNMFTQDFMLRSLLVRGEASNVKYHSSGHIYFTLKDQKGTLACVMFAGNRDGLKFKMADGQQVIVFGNVDVYERDGKYQLYAKQIMQEGGGILHERFEKLKKELEEMGLFASEYKRPIPKYIKTLGVVTAPTGAAVRDIIQIATRRNPYVQIILYPAIVQGEYAPQSIVQGIHALEQLGVDVLIVGRGGGSMEDLWAFNERIVAETIFNCEVPVISAVGHETDTTIADFVSDLRAPTPSAAAELAVYDYELFMERLFQMQKRLKQPLLQKCAKYRAMADQMGLLLEHKGPANRLKEQKMYAVSLEEKLEQAMENKLRLNRHRLDLYIEKMKGLSPLDKLTKGYGYIQTPEGRNLIGIEQVEEGDVVTIQVSNGQLKAEILEKNGHSYL